MIEERTYMYHPKTGVPHITVHNVTYIHNLWDMRRVEEVDPLTGRLLGYSEQNKIIATTQHTGALVRFESDFYKCEMRMILIYQ